MSQAGDQSEDIISQADPSEDLKEVSESKS